MSVVLLSPKRFHDDRGWFSETYSALRYAAHGIDNAFCQDNQSLTKRKGTIRGLHFQRTPSVQAKLVRCLSGGVFDVAVDLRKQSPTFGQWVGAELSAANGHQLFIPAGYAHGFVSLEDNTEIAYKVDAYYDANADGGINWNDQTIAIDWMLNGEAPTLSEKDANLPSLEAADFDFPYNGLPLLPLAHDG